MPQHKFYLFLTVLMFAVGAAQAAQQANGTATVRVDEQEYTNPVVCDDTSRPESGRYTEPQRITRERTGLASGVRLTIGPWKDASQPVVTSGRHVAWVPAPSSGDGTIEMTLATSAASTLRDGVPHAACG